LRNFGIETLESFLETVKGAKWNASLLIQLIANWGAIVERLYNVLFDYSSK